MRRLVLRSVGLLGVLGLISQPLSAQERFDIAVYPYATAQRGEWELEGLLNFSSRGTGAFDGKVAPTQGQWRFAAEVTRGITDHWELTGYLLGAQTPGLGLEYAGWRLRSRMRAPESWRFPVKLGFNVEYETARPAFSESGFKYAEDLSPAWGRLTDLVRSGRPPMTPETILGDDEEKTRNFVLAMHERARGIGSILAHLVDLSGRRRLLDVGGGPGTYSASLVQQTPGLSATVLDVPGVLKVGILYGSVARWLGDAGWVVAVRAAHRRPDLQGRPVTIVGSVARVYDEGGKRRADLELQIINQEGQPSVRGFATVEFWH